MAAKSITLKTFRASELEAQAGGHLAKRFKLFNWGLNKTNQGDFTVDDETLRVFEGNQTKLARNKIQVDFNHNTVPGTPAYEAAKGSPEIAGYGVPVVVKGEGIFLEGIETTPSGIAKSRDYLDLSPSPLVDEQGRVLALHSVALCPAGSVEGLTVEAAAMKALSADIITLTVPETKLHNPNDLEGPNAYKGAREPLMSINDAQFSEIKRTMGMPEDCTYESFMEKLKATMEGPLGAKGQGPITPMDKNQPIARSEALSAAEPALKMFEASLKEMQEKMDAKLVTLSAKLAATEGQLDAAKVRVENEHRSALIAQAGKDGKVIPLSADQLKDKAQFPNTVLEAIITNLQPVVPLKANLRPLSADKAPKTMADSAAAITRQIKSQYGEVNFMGRN